MNAVLENQGLHALGEVIEVPDRDNSFFQRFEQGKALGEVMLFGGALQDSLEDLNPHFTDGLQDLEPLMVWANGSH